MRTGELKGLKIFNGFWNRFQWGHSLFSTLGCFGNI